MHHYINGLLTQQNSQALSECCKLNVSHLTAEKVCIEKEKIK